jgi:hypothetical protein
MGAEEENQGEKKKTRTITPTAEQELEEKKRNWARSKIPEANAGESGAADSIERGGELVDGGRRAAGPRRGINPWPRGFLDDSFSLFTVCFLPWQAGRQAGEG